MMLKKRLKNFHVSKSDFCKTIIFTMIPQDDKGALINIESVLRLAYHVACQGGSLKRDLLDIYLSTYFVVGGNT